MGWQWRVDGLAKGMSGIIDPYVWSDMIVE